MKKFKIAICCCLSNLITIVVLSQNAVMIHCGEIQYEKRINTYAVLDEYYVSDNMTGKDQFAQQHKEFAQQYKVDNPQFGITNFILSFNDAYSLYEPAQSTLDNVRKPFLTTLNTVYSDLQNHTSIEKKNGFGNIFLVNDSIRKIQWKITGETREIAGFACRRANAMIMDSVYVVAFYTDQIVPKTGPESFTGLPGIILGIALPHEHITWMATHVNAKQVSNKEIRPPIGGTKVNNDKLLHILQNYAATSTDKKTAYLFLRNYMF